MDNVKEWQRLTRLYTEKSDIELRELAQDFNDLTEIAQQILRDELKKRSLPQPENLVTANSVKAARDFGLPAGKAGMRFGDSVLDADSSPREDQSEAEVGPAHEYSWKVVLCECDEREDATDLMTALERAGIRSWYDGPDSPFSLSSYGPRILVAADELDRARLVMEQPISEEIRNQTRTAVPDFESPCCAKCGAADPLLMAADTGNTWQCEECGAEWTETLPEASESGATSAK